MAQRIRFHRELIEFGALPIAKWLGGDDGPAAVQQLLQSLIEAAGQNSQKQCEALGDQNYLCALLVSWPEWLTGIAIAS